MQIIKVIATGILGGIFLFAVPFLLFKALFFLLFIGLLFRLFGWRRRRRWMYYHMYRQNFERTPYKGRETLEDPFQQCPRSV